MKKLFHYVIIFLVIYWCINNIKGCSVPKVAEAPKIEQAPEYEEHQCGDCTEPIEEVTNDNEQVAYEYLKNAIIRTEANPKSFVELSKQVETVGRIVTVTINYSIINDINQRVNRRCIGTHEFTSEGVLISVDVDDKRI